MIEPTHYLNITLGIDFAQVFKPERIEGVKFMLGAKSDEDIISIISNNIIIDAENALKKQKDYVSFVDANIKSASTPVSEQQQEVPEEVDVEEYLKEFEKLDSNEEQYEVSPDVSEEQYGEVGEDELIYDNYGINLTESINNDIFSIESHLGTDIKVYLREHEMYAKTVVNELGEVVPIASLEELGEQAEELQDEDYVIEYKDMQGEVKYGKRNLNKTEETEERV